MTDDLPLSPLDADDALAAEYVLGVLAMAERVAAETRMKNDTAFAARVTAWERRLEGLNEGYDATPAPDLSARIAALDARAAALRAPVIDAQGAARIAAARALD